MNKKGVSDVITTVLLVLIVLAAVGIVWLVVSSFLNNSTEQIDLGAGFSQLDIVDNSIKYLSSDVLQIKVKRDSNPGNITGLRIIIESEQGNVQSYDIETPVKELETKTIDVSLQGKITNISKVSIAPRTPVKNKIKTGNTADEKELSGHVVSDERLVLYMPLNKDANDKSGNGNNGAISGAVQTNGKFEQAYYFDGVNDFISIDSINPMDNSNFSLFFWFNSKEVRSGTFFGAIGVGYGANLGHDWGINTISNQWRVNFRDSTKSSEVNLGLTNDNSWHFYGVSFKDGNVSLYKDGYLAGSTITSVKKLSMGSNKINVGTRISDYFINGEFDEVRIYNRTLSAQEIYYLYKYN
ncbi:MAG TPA: LamG domain-containing protein [Candidatus Nanoarchaeia archaeon]|nr:LamG domain-containing protein [Candidatus Pacearchaeota archaeon]HLC56277.1 LamG domain-containing protein [Candidatus Nanoarchaeia archaeon]